MSVLSFPLLEVNKLAINLFGLHLEEIGYIFQNMIS